MGYETTLILDAIVPAQRIASFSEALELARKRPDEELAWFLRALQIEEGMLQFRTSDRDNVFSSEYPDSDGLVSSIFGKMDGAEDFATWLCAQGAEGRVILHSLEGDGCAFGWEFGGGRIRDLDLVPITAWRRPRLSRGRPKLRSHR